MKTPTVTALRIGTHTNSIESKIDDLMGEVGQLLVEMSEFTTAANLERGAAQRPFARVTQLQSKLVEARSKIVGAHSDMRRIAERADFPTYCPPSSVLTQAANG